MSTANTSDEKLHEALRLLNEAAHEKKDALVLALGDQYTHLKELVMEKESKVAQNLSEAKRWATEKGLHYKEVGLEKTKEMATAVDESVHRNPWPYIGGAALGGLLLGYILGKKS